MANHFISSNRGKQMAKTVDFTFATSTTSGDDLELRIADGASLTRRDVVLFLDRVMQMMQAGPINGSNFPDK